MTVHSIEALFVLPAERDAVESIVGRRIYRYFLLLSHNLLMEIVYVLKTLARRKPLFTRMTIRKYLRFGWRAGLRSASARLATPAS